MDSFDTNLYLTQTYVITGNTNINTTTVSKKQLRL